MTDTFNYSLVKSDNGTYSIRSTVKSFNLDHVTDKDIVSFYKTFSSFASFDTGLLPLDGTGVLAIRSAGPHTQVVTQHAPGMYHVNWGSHEGDRAAKAYYVAQPYRIVIGDFQDGNLLGARMFYSPLPITSPGNLLYHVNLPNINCKGYRGNGVGWICLYHKDDWSSLPFNEKVARFIERCSGVETYNDANMSETDGPRFYASLGKPSYFTNPSEWQAKSEAEGYFWTLDSELLIPVLVKDLDHQDKHYPEGEPLTLAMAMLGNYQAYYTDTEIPKMYNVISRPDLNLSNKNIADFIKKAFAKAPVSYQRQDKDNPYEFTVNHRQEKGSEVLSVPTLFDEIDGNLISCECCEENFEEDDLITTAYDSLICSSCIDNYYIYVEHLELYYSTDDVGLRYSEKDDTYYHKDYDLVSECAHCGEFICTTSKTNTAFKQHSKKSYSNQNGEFICVDCHVEMINDNELSTTGCFSCSKEVINSVGWNSIYPTFEAALPSSDSLSLSPQQVSFCSSCAKDIYVCPCGLIKNSSDEMTPCTPTTFDIDDKVFQVDSCCSGCLSNATEENGQIVMHYQPFDPQVAKTMHSTSALHVAVGIKFNSSEEEDDIF